MKGSASWYGDDPRRASIAQHSRQGCRSTVFRCLVLCTVAVLLSLISDADSSPVLPLRYVAEAVWGNGTVGHADLRGTTATFAQPAGVARSARSGLIFVADQFNHNIRQIFRDGSVITLCGAVPDPNPASGYNDAVGTTARFRAPTGIALDESTSLTDLYLYVADQKNHAVRKITVSTASVENFVGQPTVPGTANGIGPAAYFNEPSGVALAMGLNALFVADTQNGCLRRVLLDSRSVVDAAGPCSASGTGTPFDHPFGVWYSSNGDVLWVTDPSAKTVSLVVGLPGLDNFPATVTLLCGLKASYGFVDGIGTDARFNAPYFITAGHSAEYAYVGETPNGVVRVVTRATRQVQTLNVSFHFLPNVSFSFPSGIVEIAGWPPTLLIADHDVPVLWALNLRSASRSASLAGPSKSVSESQTLTTRTATSEATPSRTTPLLSASSSSSVRSPSLTQTPLTRDVTVTSGSLSVTRSSPLGRGNISHSGPTLSPSLSGGSHIVKFQPLFSLTTTATTTRDSNSVTPSNPRLNEGDYGSSSLSYPTLTVSAEPTCEWLGCDLRPALDCTALMHASPNSHGAVSAFLASVAAVSNVSDPTALPCSTIPVAVTAAATTVWSNTSNPGLVSIVSVIGTPSPLLHWNVTCRSRGGVGAWLLSNITYGDASVIPAAWASVVATGSTTVVEGITAPVHEQHMSLLVFPHVLAPPRELSRSSSSLDWLLGSNFRSVYSPAEIRVQLTFQCPYRETDRQVHTIAIPVSPLALPTITAVTTSVSNGVLWASIVATGPASASSVGRVTAVRRVMLCTVAGASSGGFLGWQLPLETDGADDVAPYARGAIAGNSLLLFVALTAACLAAALFARLSEHSITWALLRFCMPSALLPLWVALIPSTAGGLGYLAAMRVESRQGLDRGMIALALIVLVIPMLLLTMLPYVCARMGLTCVDLTAAERNQHLTDLSGVRWMCRISVMRTSVWRFLSSSSSTTAVETSQRMPSSPAPHATTTESLPLDRAFRAISLEHRVIWYPALDAAVLIVAGSLGAASGTRDQGFCRRSAVSLLCLYIAQWMVCVAFRPFSNRFSWFYSTFTLAANSASLAIQLYLVMTLVASNTAQPSQLQLVSAVLDLMVVGVSTFRMICMDVPQSARAVWRLAREAHGFVFIKKHQSHMGTNSTTCNTWKGEQTEGSGELVAPTIAAGPSNPSVMMADLAVTTLNDEEGMEELEALFWGRDGKARTMSNGGCGDALLREEEEEMEGSKNDQVSAPSSVERSVVFSPREAYADPLRAFYESQLQA